MWNLFRRKSAPSQPTQREKSEKVNASILSLRTTITQHEKRQVHLQKLADRERDKAKALAKKKDKKGALQALKKKKMYDKSIASNEAKILNLQSQIITLEDALMNAQTLDAMTIARDAMGNLVNDDTLEQAETLADDMVDTQDQLKDLNDALSRPIGMMAEFDEDELMQELDELEELDLDLEEVDTTPQLKQQPQVNKKQVNIEEETLPDIMVSPPSKPIVRREMTDEEARDLKELDQLELVMSAQIVVEHPSKCAIDERVGEMMSVQLVGVSQ